MVFWASRGWILMKIGGNQAEAFPDLPIQPRNLDFVRKTGQNSPRRIEQIRQFFLSEKCLILLSPVKR